MKLWICDDLQASAEDLAGLLQTREDVSTRIFTDPAQLLQSLEKAEDLPDAVILDIDYGGRPEGLNTGKAILSKFPNLPVLFVTAYSDQYAQLVLLDCPGTFGYLTKPFSREVIHRYLEKLQTWLEGRRVLKVRQKGQTVQIPESIIVYIESFNHRADIHTTHETISVYERLSDLLDRLSGTFFSPHQSYLVNLDHVVRTDTAHMVLDTGMEVPISRKNKKIVQTRFCEHLQKKMEEKL